MDSQSEDPYAGFPLGGEPFLLDFESVPCQDESTTAFPEHPAGYADEAPSTAADATHPCVVDPICSLPGHSLWNGPLDPVPFYSESSGSSEWDLTSLADLMSTPGGSHSAITTASPASLHQGFASISDAGLFFPFPVDALPFSMATADSDGSGSQSSAVTAPDTSPPTHRRGGRRKQGPGSESMRELRKRTKPEKCPYCPMGYPYRRERDRHIVTNHREQALEMGLETGKGHVCNCGKSYAREDHLTRHLAKTCSLSSRRRGGTRA